MVDIGAAFKIRLRICGKSHKKLAEITGMSEGAIGQFVRNLVQPENETLAKYAKALNCSVEDLLAPRMEDLVSQAGQARSKTKEKTVFDDILKKVKKMAPDDRRALHRAIGAYIEDDQNGEQTGRARTGSD